MLVGTLASYILFSNVMLFADKLLYGLIILTYHNVVYLDLYLLRRLQKSM